MPESMPEIITGVLATGVFSLFTFLIRSYFRTIKQDIEKVKADILSGNPELAKALEGLAGSEAIFRSMANGTELFPSGKQLALISDAFTSSFLDNPVQQGQGTLNTINNMPGLGSQLADALAPTFGATVVTGGAVAVPVYSDGTNWKVG